MSIRPVSIVSTVLLGFSPPLAAELYISRAPARDAATLATADEALRDAGGLVVAENPFDGTHLVDLDEDSHDRVRDRAPWLSLEGPIEGYPTQLPGGVRVIVIVDTSDRSRVEALDSVAGEAVAVGGIEAWRSAFFPIAFLDVPPEEVDALVGLPGVEFLAFNTRGAPATAQSLPLIGLNLTGPITPWYWPSSWVDHYVAVLDTGVVNGWPLSGRVNHALGACFSGSGTDTTSTCPGGAEEAYGATAALPCDTGVDPGCVHGTWVSSVAVSSDSSYPGVIAANDVQVLSVKVYSFDNLDNNVAKPYRDDVIQGLEYVYQAGLFGIKVGAVNFSGDIVGAQYSSDCDADFHDVKVYVDALRTNKIPVVVAAGNVGHSQLNGDTVGGSFAKLAAPACISTAITVGATTDANIGSNGADQVARNVLAVNWTVNYFSTRASAVTATSGGQTHQ
jgi:hypothetical protein